MIEGTCVKLYDMVMSLSNAIDLVSTTVHDHQKRVAYIASGIAAELGLSKQEQEDIIMAGVIHDIGAMFLDQEIDSMGFETGSAFKHAEMGYFFLNDFEPLARIAPMVRYHHIDWDNGKGEVSSDNNVPLAGHIINLADSVECSIDRNKEILGQVKGICEQIQNHSPKVFKPDLVQTFLKLAKKEAFWLEVISPNVELVLAERARSASVELNIDAISDLAKLFSHIIDFRSGFTAVHSSGVAAISHALAGYLGWPKQECIMIRIAGNLHDLGKLAVPLEILEKPGKLTNGEFNIIKAHTFDTQRILGQIGNLSQITKWASLHHERLDGQGYPFHNSDESLCLGARIMAVADVFTAITEDRPYRKGMDSETALQVLQQMAGNKGLDAYLVQVVKEKYSELNATRIEAQQAAINEYQKFAQELELISQNSLTKRSN